MKQTAKSYCRLSFQKISKKRLSLGWLRNHMPLCKDWDRLFLRSILDLGFMQELLYGQWPLFCRALT